MNNAEKFKQIFGLYATELWSMPESDFLEWLNRAAETAQIDHVADTGKKAEGDCISRQKAIDALARMMPRSYTPDGSHPADEEIFRAQEVFADCIEALEILPSAQPATSCSEIPNGSDDTISRQAAIDALDEQIEQCNKALGSFDISPKDEYAIKVERASLEAYKEQLENMPSAQPDRDVIDDCLYHIYKNISVHTATGGVITIRYYMEKLYEEIYGKGKRPWWMT